MTSYSVKFTPEGCIIGNIDYFDPAVVFDCGQCFRFDRTENGTYKGIAMGRVIEVVPLDGGEYLIPGCDEASFPLIADFLALDDDYSSMRSDILSSMRENGLDTAVMEKAMEVGKGIRLLHQEKWEALCSFIISQNNNIPRIKKIVRTISERFGEKIVSEQGAIDFSFPSPKKLLSSGEDAIFDCRTGFRAKYIYDAAKRVSDGETDLEAIAEMNCDDADKELRKIKGVGPKVSACALLFGFGKLSFFPVDVWVKRVMAKYYPEGTEGSAFGRYAGLAQQYLFYLERYTGGESER